MRWLKTGVSRENLIVMKRELMGYVCGQLNHNVLDSKVEVFKLGVPITRSQGKTASRRNSHRDSSSESFYVISLSQPKKSS